MAQLAQHCTFWLSATEPRQSSSLMRVFTKFSVLALSQGRLMPVRMRRQLTRSAEAARLTETNVLTTRYNGRVFLRLRCQLRHAAVEFATLSKVRHMRENPGHQICRLCQRPRTLRVSHFMPSAFYYHLGLDESGTFQNKALQRLTRTTFARVPGQMKKHLLCSDCEQRFSSNGEAWVSTYTHQVGRGFKLQQSLARLNPRETLGSGVVYHAADDPTLDWAKLAYFALSIFWRGTVDPWTKDQGEKPFILVDATLRECLRLFLLGEEDYPQGIMLMLKVSSTLSASAHMISFPSNGDIELPGRRWPQCTFVVPGMIFTLVPGPGVPETYVQQGCLIRGTGHPVFLMKSDDLFMRETMILASKARPSQKLIDEALAKWRELLTRR